MLKIGCVILSLWTILNLVPSLLILINTIFRGGHTPALYAVLNEEQVNGLSAEVLATLDSIAVFANGTNIAFCLVSLFAIWMGLNRRQNWSFWGLLAGFTAALLAGLAADYMVGTVAPQVNAISAGILVLGFVFVVVGLLQGRTPVATARERT